MLYFLGLLLRHKDSGNTAAMSQLSQLHRGVSGSGSSDPKESPMTEGREGEGFWERPSAYLSWQGRAAAFRHMSL